MQNKPYRIKLEAGRNYAWCTCGLTSKEPFCDGSHGKVGIRPLIFTVEETKVYSLCGCKITDNQPFCDGTHKNIVEK